MPAQHGRSLLWGLALGLASLVVLLGLAFGPLHWLTQAAGPGVREKLAQFGAGEHFLLYGIVMSLLHSAFEEYYWRWFLARGIAHTGIRTPHALAAAAFSLHHIVVIGVYLGPVWGIVLGAGVGLGGWLWSRIYVATGSLLGAWVAHLFADVAIVLIGLSLLG